MEVTIEEQKDIAVTVVKVEGEITINTARELEKTLNRLLNENNYKLILDLKEVPYVDSTGLATFIAQKLKYQEKGGDVKLANPNKVVGKVLDVTRLDRTFEVYPSLEQAIESYK